MASLVGFFLLARDVFGGSRKFSDGWFSVFVAKMTCNKQNIMKSFWLIVIQIFVVVGRYKRRIFYTFQMVL